jgi:predicted metal-binding membrane protein
MIEKTGVDHRRTGAVTAPMTAHLLLATVGVAWLIVILAPVGMDAGTFVFVAAWTAMMAAMMLPSAAPLVLLYRRGSTGKQTAILTAGYLTVWAAAGVPAYLASALMPMTLAPVALLAAGLYQLTPLKQSCLERCRSPADFLVQRWGHGPLRLGVEHGLWCLGCCWGLMAVLVLVGSMGLAWVVALAAIVALEKLTRHGVAWSRASGVAFLIAAFIQGMTA